METRKENIHVDIGMQDVNNDVSKERPLLVANRKESMTVRAELMAGQERERQFQLPSIQVT